MLMDEMIAPSQPAPTLRSRIMHNNMLIDERIAPNELRTPRENGETLVEPAWGQLSSVVKKNQRLRAGYDYDIQGRSLRSLMQEARDDLIEKAVDYTSKYRDVPNVSSPPKTVLLAGHQPLLFHPGVWFKNFSLGHLARRLGGVGVNLLIDSDTVRSVSIQVPVGNAERAQTDMIAYDRPTSPIPFEEEPIGDRGLFESFGRRAAERIRPIVANPLVQTFWPQVLEHARMTDNLGACLAGGRHRLEAAWGNLTLELPMSRVSDSPAFRWLFVHVVANLPRFIDLYNTALAEYRTEHRLRGLAHPVPDLHQEDDWLEAPFWVWKTDSPKRRRLFIRDSGHSIVLGDHEGWQTELSLTPDGDGQSAVEQLADLASQGIRIRSRALITTLFSRLFLGDLFLHGIGGAKYDQVTDVIVRRYFGLEPPRFATLSATLRLPTEAPQVNEEDERRLRQSIRELRYHPERFLSGSISHAAREHVTQKKQWIETPKTSVNARERHQAIEAANLGLQPSLLAKHDALIRQRITTTARLRAATVLQSRAYAFCLHPHENLTALLLDSFAGVA